VESVLENLCGELRDTQRFWIDMESGARTDNEFDLKLVEDILSICEPYVVV
jgi:hypothetical protein